MSSPALPDVSARPQAGPSRAQAPASPQAPPPTRSLDALLIAAFLGLTFLYGLFPQKDFDVWWHLRTGQLIRETGEIPKTDLYTFTAADAPWIDLHWGFQVASSWIYDHSGFVGLNLAKCAVTALAVGLLITAKAPGWPFWIMLLAWQPALYMLGGRMYVRPETMTLLWLSAFLAILFRWRSHPRLAYALPILQVAWVNTQGLFVLGPFLVGVAFLDAALAPGAFAPGRGRWWRHAILVTGLTGLACLLNPYGLRGALFPLELLKTMGDPTFGRHIAELSSIPKLVEDWGLGPIPSDPFGMLRYLVVNFPAFMLTFQVQLATIALGAVSFPLMWWARWRLARDARAKGQEREEAAPPKDKEKEKEGKRKAAAKPRLGKKALAELERRWLAGSPLQPMRFLLFLTFTYLSWKATRNSHQFAAVVGAVTAWNFGEWGMALARKHSARSLAAALAPRLAALGVIFAVVGLLLSGKVYEWGAEGRTVGLGEEPLWYAHDAVEFAGREGMPERFLSFHDGHSALYAFHNGPKRKIHTDARLEVIGPERYARYLKIKDHIRDSAASWPQELEAMGNPAILVDHQYNADVGARLLGNPSWRCARFDSIAALYLHENALAKAGVAPVDFGAEHFRRAPNEDESIPGRIARVQGFYKLIPMLTGLDPHQDDFPTKVRAAAEAVRLAQDAPDRLEGWKLLGLLEFLRPDSPTRGGTPSAPRWDGALAGDADLHYFRAIYALEQARLRAPQDFLTLSILANLVDQQGDRDVWAATTEELLAVKPINKLQTDALREIREQLDLDRRSQQGAAKDQDRWENRAELNALIQDLLRRGAYRKAAGILRDELPRSALDWGLTDTLARLLVSQGQPAEARRVLSQAREAPSPELIDLRIALTHWIEGNYPAARERLRAAIAAKPDSLPARRLLAQVELDAGDAPACLAAADDLLRIAPADSALARWARRAKALCQRYVPLPR